MVAQRQTKGRGTRGRTWMHGSNNLLMTVAIKRALLPIPLHLLPLRFYNFNTFSMFYLVCVCAE